MRIELCTTPVECFNSPRSRAGSGVAGAERGAETEAAGKVMTGRKRYERNDVRQKPDVNADR
jgi:hypothetical protein